MVFDYRGFEVYQYTYDNGRTSWNAEGVTDLTCNYTQQDSYAENPFIILGRIDQFWNTHNHTTWNNTRKVMDQ